MYELRNKYNSTLHFQGKPLRHMVLNAAKAQAEALAKKTGDRVDIYEVKQIWTTQSLEEAINKK